MPPCYYTFSTIEIRACRSLGQLRAQSKKNTKVQVLQGRDHDHHETVGILGEAAVAKFLGFRVDAMINAVGDGGVDMTYHGMTIDVKSTEVLRGELVFRNPKKCRADIIILTVVEYQDRGNKNELLPFEQQKAVVRLAGWIYRKEFLAHASQRDFGYGPVLALPQSYLNPMRTFPLFQCN